MEVKFEISEDKVKDFSNNAKKIVVEKAKSYVVELINEAERLEWSMPHTDNASNEVTSNHVTQAANKFKSSSSTKKRQVGITILKIFSEIFIFIAGIMFIPDCFISDDKTLNTGYFIIFFIIATIAIITTIITHFIGGE